MSTWICGVQILPCSNTAEKMDFLTFTTSNPTGKARMYEPQILNKELRLSNTESRNRWKKEDKVSPPQVTNPIPVSVCRQNWLELASSVPLPGLSWGILGLWVGARELCKHWPAGEKGDKEGWSLNKYFQIISAMSYVNNMRKQNIIFTDAFPSNTIDK